MEDIAFKWIKYVSTIGSVGEWALEYFPIHEDELSKIDPNLPDALRRGSVVKIPGRLVSIFIEAVNTPEDIRVHCITGYDGVKIKVKEFKWNLQQMGMFLDYVEKYEIE